MNIRGLRWLVPAVALLVVGCLFPVQDKVDHRVCELASLPHDLAPDSYEKPAAKPTPSKADPQVKSAVYRPTDVQTSETLERAAHAEQAPPDTKPASRFSIPGDFPGANAPPIVLPPLKPENEKERTAIINKLFPPLQNLGADPKPQPGPEGKPLTLADLQRLAMANSPAVRQAAANVEAARGAAIQAGAYPNPTIAYESDDVGTNGGPGYQGGYIEQLIKVANKLGLARAAAAMDLANAELALRRAETDLTAQVRGGFFAVLVANESMTVSGALAKLTTDVYDIQVDMVRKGGISAAYEPAQLRVQAVLARAAQVQARNRYTSAWKQLAASLGLPGMPPTELAGRIDIPIPRYDHAKVLAIALEHHTDILTARNTLSKAQFNLKLAQVTPIPDVLVHMVLQKDYTAPPNILNTSLQVSIPVPIWDRNEGGIIQAQGNMLNASDQEHQVRDQLTQTLADAFERYENNRVLLEWYRDQILPDQVRAYRGIYERYQVEGGFKIGNPPMFGDVVTAQQTLSGTVQGYLTALGALWQAVVDVANVMQTDDLFQINGVPQPTLPVCQLPVLPCTHPCSPLQGPELRGADGEWPAATPPRPEDGPMLTPPAPVEKMPK